MEYVCEHRRTRLLAMVALLKGGNIMRAADFADHFKVDIRTVYRDVATLVKAGAPIEGEAGVGYMLRKIHVPPLPIATSYAVEKLLTT